MGDPAATEEIRAAGAVLWRPAGSAVEVALVHRPRYDDWSFAKGKALPGEHPPLTAVREVREETGIRPVLGRPLRRTSYLVSGQPKRVDYWAATPSTPWAEGLIPHGGAGSRAQAGWPSPAGPGGQPEPGQSEFVPNDEVDEVAWLAVDAAARRLSYERDVGLLREFASAPAPTFPYIFLRHASALEKEGWPDTGLLRPLDEAGRAAAWALAGLLACFGVARVFSSPAARCVETVLPYSVHAGVTAAAEPAFGVDGTAREDTGTAPGGAAAAREDTGTTRGDAAAATGGDGGAARGDVRTAWGAAGSARLAELLADDLPTILCGHRETLPSLYAQAVRHFGATPPAHLALAKGSFAVLHIARTAGDGPASLVATEQHDVVVS
jgi:8-oxo-dGTP pyrophosphatase MutT (NUDIX family)/broad specificity phosphatase PhoE